jgi:hypothetical protein
MNASERRRIEVERGIDHHELPPKKCSNRKKLAFKPLEERRLETAASPKAAQKQ